jgi:hypothetical protein
MTIIIYFNSEYCMHFVKRLRDGIDQNHHYLIMISNNRGRLPGVVLGLGMYLIVTTTVYYHTWCAIVNIVIIYHPFFSLAGTRSLIYIHVKILQWYSFKSA